jgi:hypothetical protein
MRVDKTLSELWYLTDNGDVGETAMMAIKAIQKLQEENQRLNSALKTIVDLTSCDDTWDFANRTLEGKEKINLPYRFNQI